jgi:hypothetical protein
MNLESIETFINKEEKRVIILTSDAAYWEHIYPILNEDLQKHKGNVD